MSFITIKYRWESGCQTGKFPANWLVGDWKDIFEFDNAIDTIFKEQFDDWEGVFWLRGFSF
ncbi:TPA: hypothetical protein JBI73_05970 [Legionella pneumophila]|nr:hypothetical protein [Legionella pneumophila]HAU1698877.1 hypothetical protein [Legionella pneumophila]